MIGDTPRDIEAAHVNRAACIAVATGPFEASELRDAGADLVVESLTDPRARAFIEELR